MAEYLDGNGNRIPVNPDGRLILENESFGALLDALNNADELLEEGIDPSQIPGQLRDKVDSIKFVLDKLKYNQMLQKDLKDSHARKEKALKENEKRLRDYIAHEAKVSFDKAMEDLGSDVPLKKKDLQELKRIRGNKYYMGLGESKSLNVTRDPKAEDALEFPELVERHVSYAWNKAALKKAVELAKAPANVASIVTKPKVTFYDNGEA